MTLRDHYDRVSHDTHYDGRYAVEHICCKANHISHAVAAIFGEVYSSANPDWNSHKTGYAQDQACADNRIGDAAPGFSYRFRRLG